MGVGELHLFETLFGRDSLIVSRFLLPQYPKLARATILALASLQGTRTNDKSEEEPGRIMHEYRDAGSPVAQEIIATNSWEFPYYGSVDATPLFVGLINAYVTQEGNGLLEETFTDKDKKTRSVREAQDAALSWMLRNMGANPEGTLEFCRRNPKGLPNQAWKDSWDSYFHKDGSIANHTQGIASIEIQGYAYDALAGSAELYHALGVPSERITELEAAAERLKESVLRIMWIEDAKGKYFALGTDRDESGKARPLAIRTSNMGHLLSSRLLDGDAPDIAAKRRAVVDMLISPAMLAASGIRTLAHDEPRFRPGAYHNGTVWLWDSYYCARGFRRHGYVTEADDLVRRMMEVIEATHKFPEFARGGDGLNPELNARIVDLWDANAGMMNRIEQPPQEIQAWTVAAVLAAEYEKNRTDA